MKGDIYTLKNGFWINSKGNMFDLGLDDRIIMEDCINFSYIYDKIIVTKRKNVITIYSATPKIEKGKKKEVILASFSNSNPNIFADVIIGEYCYTIDYNCQITTCLAKKVIHPKVN